MTEAPEEIYTNPDKFEFDKDVMLGFTDAVCFERDKNRKNTSQNTY